MHHKIFINLFIFNWFYLNKKSTLVNIDAQFIQKTKHNMTKLLNPVQCTNLVK